MIEFSRKTSLIVSSVVLMIATISALLWVLHDEQQQLFTGLSRDATADYISKLEAQDIAYQLEPESGTITVRRTDAKKAWIVTEAEQQITNPIAGFELYQNSDLAATERAQQANFTRALQGEIERTLMSFSYIRSARVHVSLAPKKLFLSQQTQAKASVTLFLAEHYQPNRHDIMSIKKLVASAVDGLTPEQVVVLDGAGQTDGLFSSAEAEHPLLELRKATESYLEQKVYRVLSPWVSAQDMAISVSVELNLDKVKILETKAVNSGNGEGLINSETRVEETRFNAEKKAEGGSLRREVTYKHGALTQETELAAGQIIKLSAGVSINAEIDSALQSQITELVRHTLGIDEARQDKLRVSFFYIPPGAIPALLPATSVETPVLQPEIAEPGKTVADSAWYLGIAVIFSLIGVTLLWIYYQTRADKAVLAQLRQIFTESGEVYESSSY